MRLRSRINTIEPVPIGLYNAGIRRSKQVSPEVYLNSAADDSTSKKNKTAGPKDRVSIKRRTDRSLDYLCGGMKDKVAVGGVGDTH